MQIVTGTNCRGKEDETKNKSICVHSINSAFSSCESNTILKTVIRIHYDTGLENSLYLRGDNDPLSWNKGLSLHTISSDVWKLDPERYSTETIQFNPLINDKTWSSGGNDQVIAGETVDIYPSF